MVGADGDGGVEAGVCRALDLREPRVGVEGAGVAGVPRDEGGGQRPGLGDAAQGDGGEAPKVGVFEGVDEDVRGGVHHSRTSRSLVI